MRLGHSCETANPLDRDALGNGPGWKDSVPGEAEEIHFGG